MTLFVVLFFVSNFVKGQTYVNVTTGSYFQDFNSVAFGGTFTNPTLAPPAVSGTIPGWYVNNTGDWLGQATGTGNNTGGFYWYACGADKFFGGRSSSSTTNLYYGVVLRNNTGSTITSIRVSYRGYQVSLASNGNNVNRQAFAYAVGAGIPAVTAGTAYAALDFVQLQTTATTGGLQITWYDCSQTTTYSACIPIAISNGQYLLLRWYEANDAQNDHHMAIDDVMVDFGLLTNNCISILPIELLDFYATQNGAENDLIWKVAAEKNVAQYIIEKSEDGIHFIEMTRVIAKAKQGSTTSYSFADISPYTGITYYRLNTLENDGEIKRDQIIYLDRLNEDWKSLIYQQDNFLHVDFKNSIPKNSTISLFDLSGKLLVDEAIKESQTVINTQNLAEGIYFIRITNPYKTENFKLIIQK